jgi:sensor histidine kinase YesM
VDPAARLVDSDIGDKERDDYSDVVRSAQFNGIGLANIEERIHMYFGKNCSLELGPGASGGAIVRIRIPMNCEKEGRYA